MKSATTGGGNKPKRTVYRCTVGGGGHVARSARDVDGYVSGIVLGLLSRPDWRPLLSETTTAPDGESMRVEAVTLRARLGESADEYADGNITAAQLSKITARVQDRLSDVEAAMDRAHRGSVLSSFVGRDPEKVWRSLTIDRKRDVVRELMTVTVLPSGRRGKTFDPELVKVEPRGQR